jgi:glycosyltransferase involved in cell wall biosynthesis
MLESSSAAAYGSGTGKETVNLSVVIPVRNQPNCVHWTLTALVEQSAGVEDFEVVVVDDQSTDRTASVVQSFAGRLDLTLIRNEVNLGRGAARNRGALAARGDHLLFLDSDSRATPDLVARHQQWRRRRPDDLVMGQRVEMGWASMSELAATGEVKEPLAFEEDQRASRGISDSDDDYPRTPWLFAATHNMSMSAEVFRVLGGFDEALVGWGYEDNEFSYRFFRHFGREAGHFRYDPRLVCYHMPHLRDWYREWENTKSVLHHIKQRHQHFDVELLSHPPNHLRIAQTLPYYEGRLQHLRAEADPSVAALVTATVPSAERGELWIGCGVRAAAGDRVGARFFDHSVPHDADNKHLLGAFIPAEDRSLSSVISVDLWRFLSPVDLSAFLIEALRAADHLYLTMSAGVTGDGFVSDVDYVVDMLSGRADVTVALRDERVTVLRCRSRT